METIIHWISTYGYEALFVLLVLGIVGLPVPDETLLIFCGYLVSQNTLHWPATFAVAAGGSLCGITISYWLGRSFGSAILHRWGPRFGLSAQRLEYLHSWFERSGHWILFIGYYIAGVRHFSAVIAGSSGVNFRSFAAYAWSGGVIWVSLFLTLGYVIGDRWRVVAEWVHQGAHVLAVVLVVALLIPFLWRIHLQRARNSAPK